MAKERMRPSVAALHCEDAAMQLVVRSMNDIDDARRELGLQPQPEVPHSCQHKADEACDPGDLLGSGTLPSCKQVARGRR